MVTAGILRLTCWGPRCVMGLCSRATRCAGPAVPAGRPGRAVRPAPLSRNAGRRGRHPRQRHRLGAPQRSVLDSVWRRMEQGEAPTQGNAGSARPRAAAAAITLPLVPAPASPPRRRVRPTTFCRSSTTSSSNWTLTLLPTGCEGQARAAGGARRRRTPPTARACCSTCTACPHALLQPVACLHQLPRRRDWPQPSNLVLRGKR